MHLYIKCKDDPSYEAAKKLLKLEKLSDEVVGAEDIRIVFEPDRHRICLDLTHSEVTLGFDTLLEELWKRLHDAGFFLGRLAIV